MTAPARPVAAVPPRLPSLTGLRFIAALGVFLFHTWESGATFGTVDRLTGRQYLGVAGVSLFFVLSGFVLVWSRHPHDRPVAFYRRRFARVFPDHVASWLLAIPVIALVEGHGLPPARDLVSSFTLLQAWLPNLDANYAVNSVEWTLSCEAFFYLLFPLAVVLLPRLSPGARRPALVALAASVLALNAASWVIAGNPEGHGDGAFAWLQLDAPFTRLPEFLIGMLLAMEVRAGRLAGIRVRHAGAALLAALAWQIAFPDYWGQAVTVVPFALLIVALAQRDAGGRPTWLARPRLVVLGEWSFAFYLLHQLVIRAAVAEGLTPHALGRGGFLVLMLVGGVAAAGALFRLVERPAERRLRGDRPRVELDPVAATAAA